MKIKQTAGRDALNDIAPEFAHLNDDVLFGEVWSRNDLLPLKERSIVTLTCLISKGMINDSLKYHLITAKNNGITKTEIAEILTHLAFYAGWPNVWAAFPYVKEVYKEDDTFSPLFGKGEENVAYNKYFTGTSYLNPVVTEGVSVHNVTFEPGCRNFWHIHHKGGQILLCTDGIGIYQEWQKPARKLLPGDSVYIAPEVKHYHGAVKNAWFSHLAFSVPADGASTTWCEEVSTEDYDKAIESFQDE